MAAGLLAATFIGWPLAAALLARARPRSIERADVTPRVALVVAARGEGDRLARRVDDALSQDYPDVVVIVAADGDAPAESAAWAARGVRIASGPPVGKTASVARAVAEHAQDAGVIAFTDATAHWSPATLRALVRPFADPGVGAVSGLVVYDYPRTALAAGFRRYQRLVVASRAAESAWGSLTSVSGSISAIRRSLWSAGRADVSDDLLIPLRVANAGLRTVLEMAAVSHEVARARPVSEYRSRVRLALGAYACLASLSEWRLPASFRLQLLGHKALRWLAPLFGLVALVTSAALAALAGGVWAWIALAFGAPVALGLLGLVPRLGRPFGPLAFALTVAAAYLAAIPRFLRGERAVAWEPEEQR